MNFSSNSMMVCPKINSVPPPSAAPFHLRSLQAAQWRGPYTVTIFTVDPWWVLGLILAWLTDLPSSIHIYKDIVYKRNGLKLGTDEIYTNDLFCWANPPRHQCSKIGTYSRSDNPSYQLWRWSQGFFLDLLYINWKILEASSAPVTSPVRTSRATSRTKGHHQSNVYLCCFNPLFISYWWSNPSGLMIFCRMLDAHRNSWRENPNFGVNPELSELPTCAARRLQVPERAEQRVNRVGFLRERVGLTWKKWADVGDVRKTHAAGQKTQKETKQTTGSASRAPFEGSCPTPRHLVRSDPEATAAERGSNWRPSMRGRERERGSHSSLLHNPFHWTSHSTFRVCGDKGHLGALGDIGLRGTWGNWLGCLPHHWISHSAF